MSTTTLTEPTLTDCEVMSLRVTDEHRLSVRFRDGLIAELDLGDWVAKQHGPMATPLQEPAFFAQVWLDHGVLTWPNGYDLDPLTVRHWAEQGHCD